MAANMLWGLVFVVPALLPSLTAFDVSLGRFLVFGLLSAVWLAWILGRRGERLPRDAWKVAAAFAIAGHVGYYCLVAASVKAAGAPVAAVIVGTLPVAVVVTSSIREQRHVARGLWVPIALLILGLTTFNLAEASGAHAGARGASALLGMLLAFGAVASWTWFAVVNADFLRTHPQLSATSWAAAVGSASLCVVIVTAPVLAASGGLNSLSAGGNELTELLAASLVLGIASSWLAIVLWNAASVRLPMTLMGQLIVIETLSGATYGYLAAQSPPSAAAVAGIGLLVAGVVLGVRASHMPIAQGSA